MSARKMAQYKAAMMRMMRMGGEEVVGVITTEDVEGVDGSVATAEVHGVSIPVWAEVLRSQSDWILRTALPLLWAVGLIAICDRESFMRNLFMPVLGVFAALLANTVPIGGGIVYVPMLQLLGEKIQLSVSFTVSVMTFGNGVFGFLHWLKNDPSMLVWESFPYTVLPSWLGSLCGILLLPPLATYWVKVLFGVFSFGLAGYVFLLATAQAKLQARDHPVTTVNGRPSPSVEKWYVVSTISFLGGLVLVTNIGIGPALVTFFLLGGEYLGYSHKQAIVTGIITGGWVCVVPFLLHLLVLKDVPLTLWIMVLPGVWLGAKLAPGFFEWAGLTNVLYGFGVFLLASSALFLL